jgi:hypothetical protein
MVDPYSDPEIIGEVVDDTRLWQTTHRHVLEHLWAILAEQSATASGRQISDIIREQAEAMHTTWSEVAKNASAETVKEVSAKITVLSLDVEDIALRAGKRG